MDENGVDHCSTNILSAQISIEYEQLQQQRGERGKRRECHGNRKLQRVRRRCRAQALKDHVTSPSLHNFNTERMDTTICGPLTDVWWCTSKYHSYLILISFESTRQATFSKGKEKHQNKNKWTMRSDRWVIYLFLYQGRKKEEENHEQALQRCKQTRTI